MKRESARPKGEVKLHLSALGRYASKNLLHSRVTIDPPIASGKTTLKEAISSKRRVVKAESKSWA